MKKLPFIAVGVLLLVLGAALYIYWRGSLPEGDTIFENVSVALPEENIFVTFNAFADGVYTQHFLNSEGESGTVVFEPKNASFVKKEDGYLAPIHVSKEGTDKDFLAAFSYNGSRILKFTGAIYLGEKASDISYEERNSIGTLIRYVDANGSNQFIYALNDGDSFIEGYRGINVTFGSAYLEAPNPNSVISPGEELHVEGMLPQAWQNSSVQVSLRGENGDVLVSDSVATLESSSESLASFITILRVPRDYAGNANLVVAGSGSAVSVPLVISDSLLTLQPL